MGQQYPEDPARFLLMGDTGTEPNSLPMKNFRRSVRPLILGVSDTAPDANLEARHDGVLVLARAKPVREARHQIWIPIGTSLKYRQAGVIDYRAMGLQNHAPKWTNKALRKDVSANRPVFIELDLDSGRPHFPKPALIPARPDIVAGR